jgi:choline dehydrogenase
VIAFMTQHLDKPIPSPALMEHIGTRFRQAVDSYASSNGIPWVRFGKDDRKIDVMQPHLAAQAATGKSGVAAIGVSQEFQRVWSATRRDTQTAEGEPAQVRGRRITLAAAIGSPAILLRSGIGPKATLAGLGIEPVEDLPGAGAGLADHPVTRLLLVPKPGSCDPQTPLAQVVLRYTAPGSGEFNDMQQVMFSHVDVAGIGGQQAVAAVSTPLAIGLPVALERPHARGRLELASTDPRVQPLIQLNFAADPEDLRRLMAGVRLAWQIVHQPEIARHTHHVALLSEETVGSDDALAAYVRATVTTQFHPCGTARMGPADDLMAVVDQHCRLRAIPNLRVVDASVMPAIPRANINLTCIMIGEHVSDWMRDEA